MKRFLLLTLVFAKVTILSFSQQKYPTADIEPYYDLNFTKAERDSLAAGLRDMQLSIQAIHQYMLDNAVPMSVLFNPIPHGFTVSHDQKKLDWGLPKDVTIPTDREQLAFYPVYKLASLIKNKKITSVELTQL